ncbi:MAG: penicillin acylase family protein [Acidobacteriota bacterium]
MPCTLASPRRPLCLVLLTMMLVGGFPASGFAQPTELSGLRGEALVTRDSNGIPHLCTSSAEDALFMLGYVHAQDRFFQMDTLRRQFSGTLAELLGEGALASDLQLRNLGLRRAAEASLAAYQANGLDRSLGEMQAYTDGINAYLASNPLPPEYAALELTSAEPWSVVDSLALGKGLAFGLSFDLLELDLTVLAGAYAQAGAIGGFDGAALLFEDVMRQAPFDPAISIPQGSAASQASKTAGRGFAAPDARTVELAKRTRDTLAQVPILEKAIERRTGETGSNWWLIAGSRSASGHAMLANDPHLGLDTPSTFYEAHMTVSQQARCGLPEAAAQTFRGSDERPGQAKAGAPADFGFDANGVSFPGAPGLVQGCNEYFCWGSTVNPMDVTDVYQEVLVIDPNTGAPTHTIFNGQPEPVILIPQVFRVNQIGDQQLDNVVDSGIGPQNGGLTVVVPRRNNGPIISIDASQDPPIGFSVQYTGWHGTLEFEAFLSWLRAENLDQFRSALQYFDVGSQNWAYADLEGNIAYYTSAELPIREDLQTLGFPDGGIPPFLIRDGTNTLNHEWMAIQNPQPQQSLGFEILPFAEMPQLVNPARGYIINANNDPVGNTLDNNVLNEVRPGGGVFYLSPGYVSLRMGRIDREIEALLADGGNATRADLERIQGNNQLLDAELVSPHVITAFANAQADGAPAELAALAADPGVAEAITRFMTWDFSSPTGLAAGYDPGDDPDNLQEPSAEEVANSIATTIWSVFRGQVVQRVIDGTLTQVGLGSFLPDSRSAYRGLAHLLDTFDTSNGVGASGLPFFHNGLGLTAEQDRDLILLQSLRAALDLLATDEFAPAFRNSTNQDDYRWGYLHRIVFNHPLGGPFDIPNAGGFQDLGEGLPGVARAGGYEAVDASTHSARSDGLNEFMFGAGPARRFVGVMDPAGIDAVQVIPGGQSGVVVSPDYASQLGRWLTNNYHPMLFTPAAIAANRRDEQQFTGLCLPGPNRYCFQDRRFDTTVQWTVDSTSSGTGFTVGGASDNSGNFAFFDPDNWEMLVKVLDGCAINGHYWVFVSAATDVSWELTIEDTESGETYTSSFPGGDPSPAITDTTAFATCP